VKWEAKTLEELGDVSRGRSKHRPRDDKKLYGGSYPFIQTADVKNANFYITKYEQTYNETGLAQSKLWEKGTLCITIAANIADTAILSFPACFPDSIIGFIPHEMKSDIRYIKYCFDILQRQFQQISQGATQDNLSLEKLLTIKFPAPKYNIQCKIADILSAYDNLIENNQKQIKLLEESAMRLYNEWFVNFKFPGHEKIKMIDGIPEGWEITQIGHVLGISKGKNITREMAIDGNIPVIAGGLEPSYYHNVYNVEAPVVTISASGANAGYISIHFSNIWASDCSFFSEKDTKYLFFFYLYLISNVRLVDNLQHGSAQPHVTNKDVMNLPILYPDSGILDKFSSKIISIFSTLKTLKKSIMLCQQARDFLLPKLMLGELEVKP
jgi:type I restriction enzyme S subunit